MRRTEHRTRSVLRERLEERRPEIEEAALARVHAIADPGEIPDPSYAEGLRASVSVALEYSLEALQQGETGTPPRVPVSLLAQARLAARHGVTLDAVLRRYFAGYTLLSYFVVEEAGRNGLMGSAELKRLAATAAGLFDRFIEAIGEEHAREAHVRSPSAEQRRLRQLRGLLDGEAADISQLDYELDGFHLAVVAIGHGAEEEIRSLATSLERRLLLVRAEQATIWAWLSGRRTFDSEPLDELVTCLGRKAPSRFAAALGEPGEGITGWRLSHRQAIAALSLAKRRNGSVVRYRDVCLLVGVHRDDLLATSLRKLYLEPLAKDRDGGRTARRILRTYLSSERNVTSTAAALEISRNTVASQLRAVEGSIGQRLASCGSELEVALRLDDSDEPLGDATPGSSH